MKLDFSGWIHVKQTDYFNLGSAGTAGGFYTPGHGRPLLDDSTTNHRAHQDLINLKTLQLPSLLRSSEPAKMDSNSALLEDKFQNDGFGSSTGPRFDPSIPRNLTVQEGQTAILSCRVSWIRLRNLHVLTVDKYKYSTDQRVSVVHNEASQEWVLRIRAAHKSDAGKYECQISTKPVLSYIVSVQVIVPRAEILNAPDIYVHQGSLINLTCLVHHGTDRPIFVYWYHGNKKGELPLAITVTGAVSALQHRYCSEACGILERGQHLMKTEKQTPLPPLTDGILKTSPMI
ncbi:Immunoglobulin I-set [Trinorchestia longiramus]|nr:Immunoglobulin I-set [Trinorchestia longiramus]